jgi:glycosyltransferase involved in cell wall biosynthesis
MKIAYLAAGAAGTFCGTCLHDNTLAAALVSLGEDVLLIPTYTPIRTDEEDVSQHKVLMGGVNVYLQEKLAIFRHLPIWLDRLLDSPWLLGGLSRLHMSVEAEKLGSLTVAMLEGEAGPLKKEVDKLVDWLAAEVRPDVVHLSNAMQLGVAREIRRRLDVPIVCSLSGEDVFMERLRPPHYVRAREELKRRAADADAFIAMNNYYADFSADYMAINRQRIHIIPHGLKLDGHGTRQPGADGKVTLGYFARICPDKGLHHLVEAFKLLANDESLPPIMLRAAGSMASSDRKYFRQLERRLADSGLSDRFEYHGELSREGKIAFLQTLDLMSVPTDYHESKGLSILEAMANAVPVVLPAHGTFPELIADTSGGVLHEPGQPADVARAIKQLVLDPKHASEMGRRGQQAIHARYNHRVMAERTREVYRQVLETREAASSPSSGLGTNGSRCSASSAAGDIDQPHEAGASGK